MKAKQILSMVNNITNIKKSDKVLVLESADLCIDIINHFMGLYECDDKLEWILNYNVWCYDIHVIDEVDKLYGLTKTFNLYDEEFMLSHIDEEFDYAIGYPYIDYDTQYYNELDSIWGRYNKKKIPIDGWNIVKTLSLLKHGGVADLFFEEEFLGRRYKGILELPHEKYKHPSHHHYRFYNIM